MKKQILFLYLIIGVLACRNQQARTPSVTVTSPDLLYQQMEQGEKQVDFHATFTEPFRDLYAMGNELLLIDFEERYSYLLETPFDPNLSEQQLSFGEDQVLTIWQEPGSDGMSDRTYPYSARWEDPNYPQLGGGDTLWMQDWSKYETAVPFYYICYDGDGNNGLGLSIAFDEEGTALQVQYRGQMESIALKKVSEKMGNENGPYPVIETTYEEIVDGKVNGTYLLTHAGIWDYAIYTRGRDGKEFSFTIDHELSVVEDTYRPYPCY